MTNLSPPTVKELTRKQNKAFGKEFSRNVTDIKAQKNRFKWGKLFGRNQTDHKCVP